eukprot:CFRG4671T1
MSEELAFENGYTVSVYPINSEIRWRPSRSGSGAGEGLGRLTGRLIGRLTRTTYRTAASHPSIQTTSSFERSDAIHSIGAT